MADHVREWTAALPSTGGKAGRTSTCEEEDEVTTTPLPLAESMPAAGPVATAPSSMVETTTVVQPAAEAPSSVVEPMEVSGPTAAAPLSQAATVNDRDGAANISSSVDEVDYALTPTGDPVRSFRLGLWGTHGEPSPGDEAGPKSACEEDDDWVIVEYNDFPTIPTYPGGAIDFSRLELEQVHLVPIQDLNYLPFLWKYYGLLGDGNDVAQETNRIALRSLLTRFLKRQLKADRILTMLDYDFDTLRRTAELDWVYLSSEEARARGFTHIWQIDWKNYECRHRRYYLCDTERT
ncbi:hypothetical protein THAOC_09417 [Thalassiosira oceanica]|uniref:Uncharacterized protein n=1 Tax=Thalassiosira oceanica TaxID=159749 RepID=K0SV81_THAOC|nr:hypothetical protein THAOC_09417 [Thalassiosira oceanica]|eukprot:EJK69335.1 hypothetical protein THAOC_09417 [Thalassiosira oceanica]